MKKSGISILLNAFSFDLERAAVVITKQKAWLIAFRGDHLIIDTCYDNIETAREAFLKRVSQKKDTSKAEKKERNIPVIPIWTPLVSSRKSFQDLKKLNL